MTLRGHPGSLMVKVHTTYVQYSCFGSSQGMLLHVTSYLPLFLIHSIKTNKDKIPPDKSSFSDPDLNWFDRIYLFVAFRVTTALCLNIARGGGGDVASVTRKTMPEDAGNPVWVTGPWGWSLIRGQIAAQVYNIMRPSSTFLLDDPVLLLLLFFAWISALAPPLCQWRGAIQAKGVASFHTELRLVWIWLNLLKPRLSTTLETQY